MKRGAMAASLSRRLLSSTVRGGGMVRIASLNVLEGGKEVRVTLDGASQSEMTLHAPWLAHSCTCPRCRQASSGQRLAQKTPERSFKKVSANGDGSRLIVEFSPNHVAEFDVAWLKEHRYDTSVLAAKSLALNALSRMKKVEPHRVSFADAHASRKDTLAWMETVLNNGVVVVENTPPVEDTLLRFISETGCEPSHRLYGTTFVVEATANPINVAYSSEALDPHQDLAYYESPPGIQLLHCIEFDETIQGGLSTFVDGHAAAELLKERHPKAFAALCRIPASFQKDHVNRADPAKMYYQRPHIQTNDFGDVTSIFWAPPFEGPLQAKTEDVLEYFDAYDKFSTILSSKELWDQHGMEFRLRKGDLVVFNNRRYLHGRTAYTVPLNSTGRRKLHGCYLEIDRFLNRIRVMKWQEEGTIFLPLKSRPGTSSFRS